MVEPRNGWMNAIIQGLLMAMLSIGIAVITNLANRVNAVEIDGPKQVMAVTSELSATKQDVAGIKKDIEYLKGASDDQKQSLREITIMLRTMQK